ncbi:JAB domain-containing protein [Palleronia sediminis]|uniref:JAB domain-containing protein n=1 Tax=Palleronia sediminis TaxID=2547833 RepID=A0A4V3B981_9RHOB|nr:DNA repair protein RadC [Palleronia sediminis]TDL78179.1 JAB domain-containing protein [Palleronia sediminis]
MNLSDSMPLFTGVAASRPPSYLADHRKRLRTRFCEGGAEAVPDYELLELLLFRFIPRRDVKPVAHALMHAFGDLNGVLAAEPRQLTGIDGVGPSVATDLKIVEATAHRMARARVMNRPVLSGWQQLLDYCRTTMAHRHTEQVRVLYLDTKNALIADEAQGGGTVDHVPVYPREVLKRALELGAKALILVHNHPSGDPTPSSADIAMTRKIEEGAKALDIVLHDHLVIGRGREVSFRAEALI